MRLLLAVSLLAGCASAPASSTLRPRARPGAVAPTSVTYAAPASAPRTPSTAPPADLEVRCADREGCPSSVAMVVLDGDEPARCTGVLVAPDRLLTASHCLAEASRAAGAPCGDAWALFPSVPGHAGEWVACAEVLSAATVDESTVLRPDYAIVRLARSIERATSPIAPEAPNPGAIVQMVSVTPHPIYPRRHELRARLCQVTDSSRAERVLGPDARAVGWLNGCPVLPGNSGSPLLDLEGRVRALVHGGGSPFFTIGVTSPVPSF